MKDTFAIQIGIELMNCNYIFPIYFTLKIKMCFALLQREKPWKKNTFIYNALV